MRESHSKRHGPKSVDSQLRVIGGSLRGRTISYNGDPGMRPMKDRVRESVFNLVGPQVVGSLVIDLFAGTGAMAIEAISRGADSAICIERKFPNAKVITATGTELGIADRLRVVPGDAFVWTKMEQPPDSRHWLVFCCPPYDFFSSRQRQLIELIETLWERAPLESIFVVESDERFSPGSLPHPDLWDTRTYQPAVISIARKRKAD